MPWSPAGPSRPRAEELDGMGLGEASRVVREGCAETLNYTRFPSGAGGARTTTTPLSGSTARCAGKPAWSLLSRRELRAQVRDHEAEVRGRERVGLETLPGRYPAGGITVPEGRPMGRPKVRRNLDDIDRHGPHSARTGDLDNSFGLHGKTGNAGWRYLV